MRRVWIAVAACWLAWAPAGAGSLEQQRQDFLAAEQALRGGDRARFDTLAEALSDYPLYPYLLYTDLRDRLPRASADEVRAFLGTYSDTPLAWQLRRRWLNQLAKRGRWQDFLVDYRPTDNVKLQCLQLQALLRTDQADKALARTEALWLHGSSRPKSCDYAFERWIRAGNPSPRIAWKRIDLAMAEGNTQLVRYLRRLLPESERAWVNYWLELHRRPDRALTLSSPASEHAYLQRMRVHAVRRLAWRDPAGALELWRRLSEQHDFSDKQRQRVNRRLAAALLDERSTAADAFYAGLRPRDGDAKLQELRLRAALARQDWQRYLDWHQALPPATRDDERWQYWRARALAATGRQPVADAIYQRLAEERSYHGFLAADRAGLPYSLGHSPVPATPEELAGLAEMPGIQRGRELFALGRLTPARREWHQATRGLDQSALVGAAKLAESWGWHGQAILTVAQGRHWDDLELRFPLAHRDAVENQAERQRLDPAWIYAVVRQESAFMHDARSHVGATGLMQLMPATARKVARRLPEQIRVNSTQLRRPSVNITLGSAYLREVLDGLYQNRVLATAAYNAGPHRVRQWLPEQAMAADLWVELVPYRETRKYLKRVLTYTAIYQARLGREPARLSDQMPTVRPAQAYARTAGAQPTSS